MSNLKGIPYFASPNSIFDLPISANEKLVLLNICRRAGPDGGAFPSIKKIAQDCSLSERTVRYALGRLRDAGYLHRETRETANGASTSNLYAVEMRHVMPEGAPDAGGRVHHVQPHYIEGRPIIKETPISPQGGVDALFEKLKAVYPRRGPGKAMGFPRAKVVFAKLLKAGVDPEAICAGAAAYAKSDRGDFTKQLDTWLNQRCWEDEYTPAASILDEIPGEWVGGIEEQKRRAEAWLKKNGGKDADAA